MADDVKTTRRYVSPKRAAQARQTRQDIIDAAHRLLVERGYQATTVETIADAAGVAIPTIYASVGNKRDLLWAVLGTAVAGDNAPRPLLDRFRDALDGAADRHDRLQRAIRFGARTMERSVDVHRIMRSAASSDPEIADALAEAERLRYQDAAAFVRLIAGDDVARTDAENATDLWFALTSYEVYDLLIADCGWSRARYETWMARILEPAMP
jgi:AcrR family transcriptional regulator